jgi:hypothetical protein
MRTRIWLAAMAAGLAWAGSASAQSASMWGPVNQPLVFQVVNTDQSQVPISGPMLGQSGFTLRSLLPKVGMFSAKPTAGTTAFPTQAQLPGKDYFAPFRMQKAQRISP